MLKISKKNHIIYFVLLILIIIFTLFYFFYPKTFNGEEIISSHISKDIEGVNKNYELNEQESSEFIKILEKSKFYRGVSRPARMFADKYISVIVTGGPIIEIYYDTNKTYVYANISTGIFLNVYYRISNKNEITKFIENISSIRESEFKENPSYYHTSS